MSKFQIDDGLMMKSETDTSSQNILKLLKRTKHHPEGRIQLDEEGQVKGPKNNVLYINEIPVTIITDKGRKIQIGTEKINVNGGHTKAFHPITGKQEDTPWRMSLGGPHRYHWYVLKLAEVKRKNPTSKDQVVPELEEGEWNEYMMYVEYLKKTGKKFTRLQKYYDRSTNDNKEFYEWVEKNKVSTDEEGNVVYGKKKEDTKDKAKKAKSS